jgi:phage terminase large subunit-like protein|tara:strand:- start:442 stop:1668 length:1227 start_codon:yes stop_codon:yes gene_type:complete
MDIESRILRLKWVKQSRPKQLTPDGDWSVWLILAGRGWGKTLTGAQDMAWFALNNPDSRIAIVAPTFADGRDTCIEGESGLISILSEKLIANYNRSLGELVLHNGSRFKTFSSDTPERLRGPQHHRAWCDELGSWKYSETWDQLLFGLRLGDNPKVIVTTTPKPIPLVKDLAKRKDVHITSGSTFENKANLAESSLEQLKQRYEGTRLGRQELYAEVLEDVEGSLWSRDLIEKSILPYNEKLPDMKRIVVAVDPAVTANKNSDETGIVVCSVDFKGRYYILNDMSGKYTPDAWAKKTVETYESYNADKVIAEVNNGGDLVERVVKTQDANVSYKSVRATRGKFVRAEPIAALYEQKRVKHLERFSILEDQLCSYNPEITSQSPDRLDALVWGLTELSARSGIASWKIT